MTDHDHPTVVDVTSDAGAAAVATVEQDGARSPLERFVSPTSNGAVLAIFVVVGVHIGMAPLVDNSFLTHLSTGRIILDDWSVPTADPYSWTAFGDPWTVQSWLASVIYAGLEDLAGLTGIRVLSTALVLGLIVGLWKLTEPAEGLLARAVAIGLPVMVGVTAWTERPFMFGLVGLVLVLLAADGRLDPRWLVPVLWLWANTHGSFPFAAGVLVLLALGHYLDTRERPDVELRCLLWTVVGMLVAVVGPLGTKVLTFPFSALEHREAFAEVKEWQPLDLGSTYGRIFLVQVLVTAVALVRVRRWRAALPTVLFAIAAITAARNVAQASVVMTPVAALGLAGIGSIKGAARPRLARPFVHAMAVVVLVLAVFQLGQEATGLDAYPEEAAAWMRSNGLMDTSSRVLSREFVGNYLEYAYGPDEVRIFIDDRVDMFPGELVETYVTFLHNESGHASSLERLDPTAILWDHDSKFGRWITASSAWDVVWKDDVWLVAVPA